MTSDSETITTLISLVDAVEQYATTLAILQTSASTWVQIYNDKGVDFSMRDHLVVAFLGITEDGRVERR